MQQRDNVKQDIESERRFNNSSYTTRLDLFQTLRISHQCIRFLFLFLFLRISFDFYLIWIFQQFFCLNFFFVNEYFFLLISIYTSFMWNLMRIFCVNCVFWNVCHNQVQKFASAVQALNTHKKVWTLSFQPLSSHSARANIYICTNKGCITYSTDFSPINNRNSCLIRRFYTIYFVLTANWLVCLFCNARDENPLLECIS